jgi:hypothetical protein
MNLVIITSVINISKNPLDYTNTRSIYTPEQRYTQTIKTITSIRYKIENSEILFLESSDIDDDKENIIKNMVDYYVKLIGDDIKEIIDGKFKASAESTQILEGLKEIDISKYSNIYKISGRYFLNDNFDYSKYNNDENIFFETEDGLNLATVFYKVNSRYIDLFKNTLLFCSSSRNMLETEFKNLFNNNYKKIEILGIEGNVSIDGYYVNW